MSEAKTLLIEIGTEELPPKSLDQLAQAFSDGVCAALTKRGIAADVAKAVVFNSPRRLAALVPSVAMAQPDQAIERRGPAVSAGLDANGQPAKALLGFAASCGAGVEELERLRTDKGEWFVHRVMQTGKPTAALMQEIVDEALKALPIAKPMRWGNHEFAFVRPVHWLVLLHGDDVIDAEVFGIRSGRESRGHRFHHPQPVTVAHPDAYVAMLRSSKVLVDPDERRERVRAEVEARARDMGAKARLSEELLHEIANLTEWPVGIACNFDEQFLDVPKEALITTMQSNQKFVPLFSDDGSLTRHFVGVANIESKDPAEIRRGYERVIRPRFADAKFFYDEDMKTPLAAQQEALKSVTYQQQLGSVWDKCVRVAELSRVIANRCGVDAALATRAASLSKCDLMTRMVGEFPELQGVMGRYYASADGEAANVVQALDEFYRPRFSGDDIAQGDIARVLAIAERLDTLAGIFAVGQKPGGSKDPFALRRAGLSLARTLIEGGFDLDLEALLREAVELLPDIEKRGSSKAAKSSAPALSKSDLTRELTGFVFDRLRGYYADQGIAGDQFDAVRAVEPETLVDFDLRLRAVAQFSRLPEAAALAAANKRIGNILRQADGAVAGMVDIALLDEGAESELHRQIEATAITIGPLLVKRGYVDCLRVLASLRAPVDAFFDTVMVMDDDADKRRNRLLLLADLRRLFVDVADISLLQSG
ncbi:MAG TPA: glycine--tRNA ligase subunit beta [Rudaea sp.]|nr:glycine--tRNA ligase subunit beta [Rudaea sp.]